MDAVLSKYMSCSVPRYTSYPTAPCFDQSVGPDTHGRWLGNLPPHKPVSLYLHVPYCRQVCWYCGCNMKLAARYEPVASYVDTLLREIDLVRASLPDRLRVSHLHWGGGTPTMLEPHDLARAMDRLRTAFNIAGDAEIAIECDPRTLTDEKARGIGALGFNRASLGVQEFDWTVQKAINRIQSPKMVRDAVERLRGAGVTGVNFDLIYGLPHQTTRTIVDTVFNCAGMRPDRIALFGYAHVPWMAKKQRMIPEDTLPDSAERLSQATAADDALRAAGYRRIGLDHFALPKDPLSNAVDARTLHRNFQGYTTDDATTLIGFGVTSIGRTPDGYVQNISETGAWARAVNDGVLPIAKGRKLTGDDALRAHVIEQIMCYGAVDTAAAANHFGYPADWFASELNDLKPMAKDGLIGFDGATVSLTGKGAMLMRVFASIFDSYFQDRKTRHSIAV